MSAPDRDAVYEGLRKQGIRAIRVDEVFPPVRRGFGGLRRRDWLVLISSVLLLSCIVAIAFWRMPKERMVATGMALPSVRTGHETGGEVREPEPVREDGWQESGERCEAYLKIAEEVEAARESYRSDASKIDDELLANYALVERVRDMSEFRGMIAYGREVVSNAREVIQRSFTNHYGGIPATSVQDRDDAQRLYGLAMEELDAAEERLECDDYALMLLDMNRGQWRVVKGVVTWKDARLERQFRIFCREQSTNKSRWERDFGPSGSKSIESKPVELPIRK